MGISGVGIVGGILFSKRSAHNIGSKSLLAAHMEPP